CPRSPGSAGSTTGSTPGLRTRSGTRCRSRWPAGPGMARRRTGSAGPRSVQPSQVQRSSSQGADDAVRGEPGAALELLHDGLGRGAEVPVDDEARVRREPRVEAGLELLDV